MTTIFLAPFELFDMQSQNENFTVALPSSAEVRGCYSESSDNVALFPLRQNTYFIIVQN
jgi:hypothetical protein